MMHRSCLNTSQSVIGWRTEEQTVPQWQTSSWKALRTEAHSSGPQMSTSWNCRDWSRHWHEVWWSEMVYAFVDHQTADVSYSQLTDAALVTKKCNLGEQASPSIMKFPDVSIGNSFCKCPVLIHLTVIRHYYYIITLSNVYFVLHNLSQKSYMDGSSKIVHFKLVCHFTKRL